MFTRIFNLVVAAVMTFFAVAGVVHDSFDAESSLYIVVAPCWLAGAIGLFIKHRLAWAGSILGAGTMFCSSLTMFASGLVLSPVAQDPTDGIGYMQVFGFVGLLISSALIFGLFWLRRDRMPNTALEPTGVGAGSSASRSTSPVAGGSAFGR